MVNGKSPTQKQVGDVDSFNSVKIGVPLLSLKLHRSISPTNEIAVHEREGTFKNPRLSSQIIPTQAIQF